MYHVWKIYKKKKIKNLLKFYIPLTMQPFYDCSH